jgi:hypothetical protein
MTHDLLAFLIDGYEDTSWDLGWGVCGGCVDYCFVFVNGVIFPKSRKERGEKERKGREGNGNGGSYFF